MARRKRSKQPNLPEATLQRAREQAGLPAQQAADEPETEVAEAEAAPVAEKPVMAAPEKRNPALSQRAGRKISSARLEQSKKRGDLDPEMVEYVLEHPTKIVSEAQLREEYGHVLYDLRNMALLAATLIIVMVIVAQFI